MYSSVFEYISSVAIMPQIAFLVITSVSAAFAVPKKQPSANVAVAISAIMILAEAPVGRIHVICRQSYHR